MFFSYFIPWDANAGLWVCSPGCVKDVDSSLVAGAARVSFEVKPALLSLDLVNFSSFKYVLGNPLFTRVFFLGYPDGCAVEEGFVFVNVSGVNLPLSKESDGFYFIDCSGVVNKLGNQVVEFYASDKLGNSVSSSFVVYIDKSESVFPFYLFLGFFSFVVIVGVVFVLVKKRFILLRLNDIENEIRVIKNLQKKKCYKLLC